MKQQGGNCVYPYSPLTKRNHLCGALTAKTINTNKKNYEKQYVCEIFYYANSFLYYYV
jgi:hypothetical protein